MTQDKVLSLILLCMPLSLLSFGGGQTIVAGLQHETVDKLGWLTAQQFTELFAISKTSPGPTTLIVALIGWHVAGLWGALAASIAMFVPSSVLMCAVGRYWERHRKSRLTRAIEQGLLPIAVGLMFAGSLNIILFSHLGWVHYVVIAGALALVLRTKIGPYAILGIVATIFLGIGLFAPA